MANTNQTPVNSADNFPPDFVKSRIDANVRCGILNKDSTEFQVRFAIGTRESDRHIPAAIEYLRGAE